MSAPLIELRDVTQSYSGREVLRVESLALAPGEVLGVAGPNGSGKSTLLRLLALLEAPAGGRVLVDGRDAAGREWTLRRRVTLLSQDTYLLKRSVLDNVCYGLKARGDTDGLERRAAEALARVGLGPEFLARRWNQLSGGEAQRVALAARLVLQPAALLLDEPTASVDEASSEAIREAALDARTRLGAAVVLVSHDRDWLQDAADRVLNLHFGCVAGYGRISTLPGPWRGEGGRALLDADGQVLDVPAPRDGAVEDACALVDAAAVRPLAEGEAPADHEACLEMVPDRMAATRDGRVHLRFAAGRVRLWALIRGEAAPAAGRRVRVAVDSTAIRWMLPAGMLPAGMLPAGMQPTGRTT